MSALIGPGQPRAASVEASGTPRLFHFFPAVSVGRAARSCTDAATLATELVNENVSVSGGGDDARGGTH